MWNFDEKIDRENTSSIKYDLREKVFGTNDVIPMWVADMDFRTPSFITDALEQKIRHGILGYSFREESYYNSLINWIRTRHNWEVDRKWIEFSPGVVPALNLCTLAYSDKDDEIIIQPPVYTPFHNAVKDHGRKLVYNSLKETAGGWIMDYESLKKAITSKTRMIIISNPHNPVGRVWELTELAELSEICYDRGIVILSDEIHSDLILPGYNHIPMASVSERAAEITVTCMAPSKTFNLAGLSTSSVIIPDDSLRSKYRNTLEKFHLHLGNIFGNIASEAAYTHGEEWLEQLLQYVENNVDLVMDYLNERIPQIKPVRPEGTYMIWLDCRSLKMSGSELFTFFIEKAGVGLNEGSAFGPGGEGFMRMNLACPRSIVEKALKQIDNAINA